MAQQPTKQARKARGTPSPSGTPAPKWSLEEQTNAALASVTVVTTLLERTRHDDLPVRVASEAAVLLEQARRVLESLNLPQVAMERERKLQTTLSPGGER